jgi:hypothetical protein
LFPDSIAVDRAAAADARIAWDDVPAKGAVYLLAAPAADEADGTSGAQAAERPLLLATVGDLRAALRRRLEERPPDVKTKRVDYGQVCTRVYWRRVDSSFAANVWYWRAARALFPATYAPLIPWRQSWWVAAEASGSFPRLRRTSDLGASDYLYAGPIRDKAAAGKLIETVEDLFDLCRYHSVLVQAPAGKACAYKEMGKCPAPCDGSVPAAWYRGQMDKAWGFVTGATRPAWREETQALMRAAASRLEFETAGKIKQRLARAAAADGEAYAYARPLPEFSFVAIQPGKGKPWVEPWLIHGGTAVCLPQVQKKEVDAGMAAVAAEYAALAAAPVQPPVDAAGMEQMAIVSHHLFRGEDDHGLYVRGADVLARGAEALVAAARALWERKTTPKPLVEQASDKGEEGRETVAVPAAEQSTGIP